MALEFLLSSICYDSLRKILLLFFSPVGQSVSVFFLFLILYSLSILHGREGLSIHPDLG